MSDKKIEAYKDASLTIELRVEDLLQRMSLEEKIAQAVTFTRFSGYHDEYGSFTPEDFRKAVKHGIGSIQLPCSKYSPEQSVECTNAMQKYLVENTRLGIPALMQEEALHGHLAQGATIFPQPIGLASSWDTDLIEEVYGAAAAEISARGGHQVFTPVLDIGRDPRWGRIEETYGEDTYLTTRMGVAAVKGLQGGKDIDRKHVVASPKHFAGYAQGDGGRNFAPTNITERVFQDQILPPFKAAVTEAGALGIMPSHAEIDGIPCHTSKRLLTQILREQWGFKGIVVSDYYDIERLDILHHIVNNSEEAGVKALEAGVDMDLPTGKCYLSLKERAQKEPRIEKLLDETVARILRIKFLLGLFENPYREAEVANQTVNCGAHKAVAKKAADKSMVLLKNKNGILPIDRKKMRKIAVIGPNAHPVQFGGYSPKPYKGVSILEGIQAKVQGTMEVLYARGCGITKNDDFAESEIDARVIVPELFDPAEEAESITEAVEVAKQSELVVLCVGGRYLTSREAIFLKGHLGDIDHLELVGQQNDLVKAVVETGIPTVVVLVNGKPHSVNYIAEHASAILEAWYAGQETGNAVADVLFGDVNPGGKLPVTIMRTVGQLPAYYSQKPSGELKGYLFGDSTPLYPFGFGLSYTTFELNNLKVNPGAIACTENAEVSVDITNTGNLAGDEVVQMYIRDKISSVTRPVKELKGFKRIMLQPGETKTVHFTVTPEMLSFTGENYERVIEPGEFEVMVGTSSVNLLTDVLMIR